MRLPDSQSNSEEVEGRPRKSTIRWIINRVVPKKQGKSSNNEEDASDYTELPEGKPESLDDQTWFELNYFPLSEINFETNRQLKRLLIKDLKNLEELQVLGSGASGTVYRLSFCPRFAMKVFESKQYADIALQHEASALAKLEGENHIEGGKVITMGLADKRVFWLILYSFLEGKSTAEYLFGRFKEGEDSEKVKSEEGKLDPLYRRREISLASEADKIQRFLENIESHLLMMNILKDVVSGLQGLHEAGTIHRDIKPDNFMTHETDERVVTTLIDFGIACRDGFNCKEFMGTPPYVPPEGFPGEQMVIASPQWDIYSVSKTLEQMIRGTPPLEGIGGFMQIQVQQYFQNEGTDNRITKETKETLGSVEKDLFLKGNAYYNWIEDILKSGGAPRVQQRIDATLMLQKINKAIEVLQQYKKLYQETEEKDVLTLAQLNHRTNKILIDRYGEAIQKNIKTVREIAESQVLDLVNDNKQIKIAFMSTLESLRLMKSLEYEGTLVKIIDGIEWRRTLKEYCYELDNEFFYQVSRFSSDTMNMLDRKLLQIVEYELERHVLRMLKGTMEKIQANKQELGSLSRLTKKARETGKIQLDRKTGKPVVVDEELGSLLEQSKNTYNLSFIQAFVPVGNRFVENPRAFWSNTKRLKKKLAKFGEIEKELKNAFEKGEILLDNESWLESKAEAEIESLKKLYHQLETILRHEPT